MCNCPKPHELFASIDDAIDRGRWFMTGVTVGPPSQVKWLYTVGLTERFGHPELLVVGICCAPCGGAILQTVAEHVAAGERFDTPTTDPTVLPEGVLHVREVPSVCWDNGWFAMWDAYYAGKPYAPPRRDAVHLVYTDRGGRFPWEPGCDPVVADLQQLTDAPRERTGTRAARRRPPTRPRRWDR